VVHFLLAEGQEAMHFVPGRGVVESVCNTGDGDRSKGSRGKEFEGRAKGLKVNRRTGCNERSDIFHKYSTNLNMKGREQ